MFGDNLSFISDTTIAACNSQGCAMKDKFKANFKIALPAAVVSLVIIIMLSFDKTTSTLEIPAYDLFLLIPYIWCWQVVSVVLMFFLCCLAELPPV